MTKRKLNIHLKAKKKDIPKSLFYKACEFSVIGFLALGFITFAVFMARRMAE